MQRNHEEVSVGGSLIVLLVILNVIVIKTGMISGARWYSALYLTLPLLILAIFYNRRR